MTFEPKTSFYSTLLPLPAAAKYAFVRSWPARDWVRAGSVWSHVLLMDLDESAEIDNPLFLVPLFRRPNPLKGGTGEVFETYSKKLSLPVASHRPPEIDPRIAARVAFELYSSSQPVSVSTKDVDRLEPLLYELLAQQWPRLRKSFSMRTRSRDSDAPWRLDLELVEKSKRPLASPEHLPEWANALGQDLCAGGGAMRRLIRRFGNESPEGREGVPTLVSIVTSIQESAGTEVADHVRSAYPAPNEMKLMKRELFGAIENNGPWKVEESERIRLAFIAGSAVDFEDLEMADRMLRLFAEPSSRTMLSELPVENVDAGQMNSLIAAIASRADLSAAIDLTLAAPDIGVLVASRKPELLEDPRVWGALDPQLALEVFNKISKRARDAIVLSLVDTGSIPTLSLICERDSSIWWRAVLSVGASVQSPEELVRKTTVLRRVLDRIGAASLDVRGPAAKSPGQLAASLLSADLSAGLWRRHPYETWCLLVSEVTNDRKNFSYPEYLVDRVLAVALLTGVASSENAMRAAAWQTVFPQLHRRLEDPKFDGEAWSVLANSLPTGDEWDRCLRLRRGLALEIIRGNWSSTEVNHLIGGSDAASVAVRSILSATQPRRRQNFLDFISGLFS